MVMGANASETSEPRPRRTRRHRLAREGGQTFAEYAMILAVVSVAVLLVALLAFRTQIASAITSASSCLQGSCLTDGGHCTDGRGRDADERGCQR